MSSQPFKSRLASGAALLTLTAFVAGSAFLPATASAEPVPYRPMCASHCTSSSSLPESGMQVQTQTSPVKVQVLNLPKGRSAVIDLPVDASDVFVSNPAVADAVLRTPRRIFVLGVDGGQSDAIFFDGMGRQILNLSIRVDTPTDELADTVQRLFPGNHVEVQSLNGHVVLSGMARNDAEADQIYRLAGSFGAKPEDVLNLMSIAGKDQVTLKVRIVEVNRSAVKQLGLSSSITYNNGTRSYTFGHTNSYSTNGSYLGNTNLGGGQAGTAVYNGTTTATAGGTTVTNSGVLKYGTDLNYNLQAFERVGLARTLAEPNLTAVSGESARIRPAVLRSSSSPSAWASASHRSSCRRAVYR